METEISRKVERKEWSTEIGEDCRKTIDALK